MGQTGSCTRTVFPGYQGFSCKISAFIETRRLYSCSACRLLGSVSPKGSHHCPGFLPEYSFKGRASASSFQPNDAPTSRSSGKCAKVYIRRHSAQYQQPHDTGIPYFCDPFRCERANVQNGGMLVQVLRSGRFKIPRTRSNPQASNKALQGNLWAWTSIFTIPAWTAREHPCT